MSIFTVKCFDWRSFFQDYFWFMFLFSRTQKKVNKSQASIWIQLCNHPDQNLEFFQLSRRFLLTPSQSVSTTGGQCSELCHHRFILLSVTSREWNHTECVSVWRLFQHSLCEIVDIVCATSFFFLTAQPFISFIFIKLAKEEKQCQKGRGKCMC